MPTAHIESKLEDISKNILMPGDPLRAKYIAEHYLTNYKLVNNIRGMLAFTGTYKGQLVTIFASGMGIPSIGIYSYELYKFYNVENIIRIGTCGSFSKSVHMNDLILSTGSYSLTYYAKLLDGVDTNYVEASSTLNKKILDTSNNSNIPIKVGKTVTSDVFDPYCSNHDKFLSNYPSIDFLGCEMEAFALFYNAKKLGRNASCIATVVDSVYEGEHLTSEERQNSLDKMIKLALDAIIS